MYDVAYTGRAGLVDYGDPVPHEHAPPFDPATARLISAAFDAAWASVKASGARFPKNSAEAARKLIADAILHAVRQGEREESKLRDIALLELARNGRTISRTRARADTAGE